MDWHVSRWEELSAPQLHGMLQLRQAVFVVEQTCAYLDLDGADLDAWHVLAEEQGEVKACARLLAPGVKYDEASIGRVCTAQDVRGLGLGRELMARSLEALQEIWPAQNIRISAQSYLVPFYQSLGFQGTGYTYLEDGIPHEEMFRASDR